MSSKRPIFLQLHQISLPLPALSSILHRVSGLTMILIFPLLAYLMVYSLESEESFLWVQDFIQQSFILSFILWGVACDMLYHLCSGIRHLLMDLHFFEELETSHLSAKVMFLIYAVIFVLFTYWYWG